MMVKIVEAGAVLPKSPLSEKLLPYVKDVLGVYAFPYAPSIEDSVSLKAVYFRHRQGDPAIRVVDNDVIITVKDDSIIVKMRKNCNPDEQPVEMFKESLIGVRKDKDNNDEEYRIPLSSVITPLLERIKVRVNLAGTDWCRIGNYKGLEIVSPYIQRLKAFIDSSTEPIAIPKAAMSELSKISDSDTEYKKSKESLDGKEETVNTEAQKLSDFERLNSFMQGLSERPADYVPPKYNQSKHRESKPKKKNPRMLDL